MAISSTLLKRPTERNLFLVAAVAFPLFVLLGYFKSYYFSAFFDVRPVANALVHAHGVVMTLWVLFFTAQIALVRSGNVRLHRRLGVAGVGLALLVVVVGMATAIDALFVRRESPGGADPHGFFIVPLFDMLLFVAFFAGAIYYRRQPTAHKGLMLMTAINFLPPAFARMPVVPPQLNIFWAFGAADLLALIYLICEARKHRRVNKVFAVALLIFIASQPLRTYLAGTEGWLGLIGWLAG